MILGGFVVVSVLANRQGRERENGGRRGESREARTEEAGESPRETTSPAPATADRADPGSVPPASGGGLRTRTERKPRLDPLSRVEQFQATVLDETKAPRLRVRELESLRRLNAITPEIEERMLVLLRKSEDFRVRSGICAGLEGCDSEGFKAEMILRLKGDPSASVRRGAAAALRSLNGDPLVRAGLEEAAERDTDRKVRDSARESLSPVPPKPSFDKPE